MKVLVCNNYYRIRGGEDISLDRDVEMLRDYGHEVVQLSRDNTEIDQVSLFARAKRTLWSREAQREAEEVIRRERPDLMHCNNLFPQLSPSIHRAANRAGVPVVQAVRNYRHFCANSALYRDGKVCEDCVGRRVATPAIRHACYRNSRVATGVVVAMQAYHRAADAWSKGVDAFFSPSQFARDYCVSAGFPGDRFFVRKNFVYPDLGVADGTRKRALYVGRLTEEKGIGALVRAWRDHNPGMDLDVVGKGDPEIVDQLAAAGDRVRVHGAVSQDEVLRLLGDAACLVFPSQWFETFGRSIAEAFSRGTPVVVSDMGAMAELVEHERNGLLFQPGNAEMLAASVRRIAEDEAAGAAMREGARESFETLFTREQGYQQLMRVYEHARRHAEAAR